MNNFKRNIQRNSLDIQSLNVSHLCCAVLSAIDKPSRATLSRLCCLPLCAVWHTLCATLCGTSVRCLDACRIALALSGVRWHHVHVHVRLSFGAFHFVCLAFGFVYGFALAAGSCFVCAAKCRFRFTTRVWMSVCAGVHV